MSKILVAFLAAFISISSFASTATGKTSTPKKNAVKQAVKKVALQNSTAKNFTYCATVQNSYWDGEMMWTAVCRRCTDGGFEMAYIMASNCAFAQARYNATHPAYAFEP